MDESFLPYSRQWIDEEDIARVVEVLREDYITTGPWVELFEERLGAVSNAAHAVAVSSGTAALHAMYFAAGLEADDEVITSPLTFAATANAARYLGATVRFVDIESDTGNLDPVRLADAITERTKLVVPVDYAGHPADYDVINDVAASRDVCVVADAAHSLGARYKERRVGSLARASEVSFHPVKVITTGEGGAVLTDDAELARRARRFRTHGMVRDSNDLEHPDEGDWYHEMHAVGFNYRLTDIQSALGIAQLERLESFVKRRREIAGNYLDALADLESVDLPIERDDVQSAWHLFVIRVKDPALRRPLFEKLRELKLGVQVHYLPVYLHPHYRRLGYRPGLCPRAEQFYARAISLPIYPKMTDGDIAASISRVRKAVKVVCGK